MSKQKHGELDAASLFAEGMTSEEAKGDTTDILAEAPPSTMPSVKRDRAKPSDAVSRAKLATTHLRVMDARKGRMLQMSDKLRAEIAELDEKRNQFILTLDDKVIAILKAGGVL